MRSASPLIAAVLLTGCTTTQQKDDRLEMRADRTIAARVPVRVKTENPAVRVGEVAVVRGPGSAIVAEVTNTGERPLTDLPIEVGVGRRTLNRGASLDYFQTHVAAIAPGRTVRWVFQTRKRVPEGRPFARVGIPSGKTAGTAASLPRVTVSGTARAAIVRNATDVTQYELPVYAIARRRGRYVAAGRALVEELGGHASHSLPLTLAGRPRAARIELETLPTIFK